MLVFSRHSSATCSTNRLQKLHFYIGCNYFIRYFTRYTFQVISGIRSVSNVEKCPAHHFLAYHSELRLEPCGVQIYFRRLSKIKSAHLLPGTWCIIPHALPAPLSALTAAAVNAPIYYARRRWLCARALQNVGVLVLQRMI